MVSWYMHYVTYRRLVDNVPAPAQFNDQRFPGHPNPFFK